MYQEIAITKDLFYVGGSDRRLALFENVYPVPKGASYNSYLLLDEKTVLLDTVDASVGEQFLENTEHALGGRTLDYLVVHHMEPDHSATLLRVIETYPEATLLCNKKTAQMIENYFPARTKNIRLVQDGETVCFGVHSLKFVFTPMVHWPEVMMSLDLFDGTLFSADAFGTFGALGGNLYADEVDFAHNYMDEARRYYINIVGKYGVQVQNAIKKLGDEQINRICPLHGPVWRKNLKEILDKYVTWSSYKAEEKGVVVFYGSVYGHTANAAEVLASEIAKEGVYAQVYDCSKTHVSELVSEAFRYSHAVFASSTYNNGIFPPVETLIADLKAHNYQNRKFALIENGSWSPQAGNLMDGLLSSCKNLEQIGEKVTLLSSGKEEQRQAIVALAKQIADDVKNS